MTSSSTPVHAHIPVLHDDGKQAWCDVCGYTARHQIPLKMYDRKRNASVA